MAAIQRLLTTACAALLVFSLGIDAYLPGARIAPDVLSQQQPSRHTSPQTKLHAFRPMDNRAREQRTVGQNQMMIELQKPLGIEWNQDEFGNVYVRKLTPGGNADQSGAIKPGNQLLMVSAAWGDEMWSTKGSGVNMVETAIRNRAQPPVRLVFATPKGQTTGPAVAKTKSDAELLKELQAEEDERKKDKKFFGLF
ncbi:unnamed protein product [Vitrella brassicaformis CCMP3155]|uniref:PDZ domain-containing protein n=1 Tax=Vitrella brassicaformis (strain CCMP3155) TaxID=1169540 RepID=A0A0G4EY75_VITBC|nr:unnamed protein product [Vitrella brassicaformis CCMP3155]|mmetsp:Transcript_45208/g.112301  ORF Transcript_45208/g.112301 Transcript_45208/m.112301 type:complete len:196 (-) Transcript_45208:763-1350(-)|eukprot:CEM04295.1 unnamed protein product [Vitrella brassicaformis CCMP3155]